jgi:hypothetical protein
MLIQREVTAHDVDRFLLQLQRTLGNRRASEWTGLIVPRRDNQVEVGLAPRDANLRALRSKFAASREGAKVLRELEAPRDDETLTVLVAAPSGWVVLRHRLSLVRLPGN